MTATARINSILLTTLAFILLPSYWRAESVPKEIPRFEPDATWPKPLPNNWMIGQVSGVSVDLHDHIWVLTRPRTLDNNDKYAALNPPQGDCCIPAPPVLEFDQAGNLIQAWGGSTREYSWPENEHGISVDQKDNVWITGSGQKDSHILELTKTGKLIRQIGLTGKPGGSNDIETLNRPASIVVSPKANEVFVADGYGNRRVIVFNAETGAYKRHWGAYGKKPDDSVSRDRQFEGPGSPQFNIVHSVRISENGLVYVGDRVNNRIQVFQMDGTFVKEAYIARKTSAPEGTAFDIAFSIDKAQQFLYVVDGSNKKVQMLDRNTLETVGYFGGHGGHGLGDFFHVHSIAADSKGNLYLGESYGARVIRWKLK